MLKNPSRAENTFKSRNNFAKFVLNVPVLLLFNLSMVHMAYTDEDLY